MFSVRADQRKSGVLAAKYQSRRLFECGERFYMKFEGLIVLTLDLELRLQLLDQQLKTGDFSFQLLEVAGGRAGRSLRLERVGQSRGPRRFGRRVNGRRRGHQWVLRRGAQRGPDAPRRRLGKEAA